MSVIANTAMLVSLHAGQWSGRKYDASATQELNASKHADADASRVNKMLVSKEVLKPAQQVINKARTEYYRLTLPWGEDGSRILPAQMYMQWSAYLDSVQTELADAVEVVVDSYRDAVRDAAYRMGDLFDINDYPPPASIRSKFYLRASVRPVPTADDFRVELTDDLQKAIKANIEADVAELTQGAVRHLWEQVGQMIDDVRDRLADPNARFRRGLLDNLVEMIDDLDRLNFAGDPQLSQLRADALKVITPLRDPEYLRKDWNTRQAASDDLKELADHYGGLWG